nr:hypothetical protein [Xanthomonas arboricola]
MIMKVQVNSTCKVKSLSGMPCAAKKPIMPAGNNAATSDDAPIASRTGRST